MFRKLILTAVIATGTLAGLNATATTADAGVLGLFDRHTVRFEVKVLRHGHWECVATYRDREEAQCAARGFERQGHAVRVEVQRGHW
ncbi:hypothetical protein [Limnoglobus roseus]|uniref:SPOR domain-containing protein n=1 Tax=Limnoglobus roseus TaxID=2598579 RepID=A0A5C1AS18_9BACT|nr:hypothetical protein [Limnoglobus roseus]QEL20947.1 hypothetical protein PX52LOC_08075 [Limnoglobus roseus]